MKRSVLILLGILLGLFISTLSYGQQYDYYYGNSSINQIDEAEKIFVDRYGIDRLNEFYDILESGVSNPKYIEIQNSNLYDVLVKQNVSFVIDGWVYVISYKPNDSENIKFNINKNYICEYATNREIWLFCKDTHNGSWRNSHSQDIVFNDEISGRNQINGKIVSLCPISDGTNVIKLPAFGNAVAILCGIKIEYDNKTTFINQLIILSPIALHEGHIWYYVDVVFGRINKNYTTNEYPKKFIGLTDDGRSIKTIDNNGNVKNIQTYLDGKIDNISINNKLISICGDYGWLIHSK